MKIKMSRNLIVLFSILTLLLILINLPMFNVKSVQVVGNINTKVEDIERIILLDDKSNIFWVNTNKMELAVEALPYVEKAKVKKSVPNELIVEIVEREPIAYLLYNKNSYIYIDNEGYVLEVSSKPLEGKPFVTGVKYGNFILNEPLVFERNYVIQMIDTLNQNIEKYKLQNYQITIDLLEDFNVKLVINDITVGLGEFENIDKKMRYLKSILTKLDEEGYMSGYIDLSDFDKPITFKYAAD